MAQQIEAGGDLLAGIATVYAACPGAGGPVASSRARRHQLALVLTQAKNAVTSQFSRNWQQAITP